MHPNSSQSASRVQLGPFWLWYRADRDDWCICWYDDGGIAGEPRTRRKSTGIGGGSPDKPPQATEDALADHYAAWRKPIAEPVAVALVDTLIADWLTEHVQASLNDPGRYASSIRHWHRFLTIERQAGRITGAATVADMDNDAIYARFMDMRRAERSSPYTISRDLSAMRQCLNWNRKARRIPTAPYVPDVKSKPGPKTLTYSVEEVAALLEAAWAIPERRHVHLYSMIALSTHGRGEAIIELDADTQVIDDLIYFNAPGRAQTKKRRSIVPIAPTLAPWLEGVTGRVIQWQKQRRVDGNLIIERFPLIDIGNSFQACLIAAGVCEQDSDDSGEPIWLPPRQKLGETKPRPKLIGIGSPNTLRHTCSTEMHARGVPEAQIDAAAGHSGDTTNKRNYRHLRPEYLKDFIAAVEDYWSEVGRLTKVHLRYQHDTKIVDMGRAKASRARQTKQ